MDRNIKVNSDDNKYDVVNNPKHYVGDIECIDAMEQTQGRNAVIDFCICNAFKYLWRHKNKNKVEDLKKARWYLDKAINKIEKDADNR